MEGGGLIQQLGINWKLFLSQTVNFFILLVILNAFVYKPLLKMIKERNEKIQSGLEKAKEAEIRLHEVDAISRERLKKADQQSMAIIKSTQEKAQELEASLQKKAQERQQDLMAQLQLNHQRQQEEMKKEVMKEGAELVKKIVVKTVELRPQAIDDALIAKAIAKVKEEA